VGTVAGIFIGKFFNHYEFGTATRGGMYVEFIHKGTHEEKGRGLKCAEDFPLRAGWGFRAIRIPCPDRGRAPIMFSVSSSTVIRIFVSAVLLIAIIVCVDHAFADGHADLMEFLFAEPAASAMRMEMLSARSTLSSTSPA